MKTNIKSIGVCSVVTALLLSVQAALAFYNPSTGMWLSRDPIGEPGFLLLRGEQEVGTEMHSGEESANTLALREHGEPNPYGYVSNDPITRIDRLGLLTFKGCSPDQQQQLQDAWNSFCQQVKSSAFTCCLQHSTIPKRLAAMCDRADTTIQCHASSTGMCKDSCAWSLPLGRTIHVCPLGLRPDPGCGPHGCTLLHEMTHLAGHWTEKWPNRVENCLQGCPRRPTK